MKMKFLSFFIVVSGIVNAQDTIPNYDFEYWGGSGISWCLSYPDYWWLFCDQHLSWGVFPSTDAYHGNYALRGENGPIQAMTPQKFKINFHPMALSCYVKSDTASNSLQIEIFLFNNSSIVDTGKWSGSNFGNTYSKIIVPITQHSLFVDSATIQISGITNVGHHLLIDYFNLDSTLNSITTFESERFTILPNPTTGIFTIESSEQISAIEIVNLLGEKVYERDNGQLKMNNGQLSIINSPLSIDLSSQPNGVYFLQLTTDKGIARKKVVISH